MALNVYNRVFDAVAVNFVQWLTATPDYTGASYPGPGTFGIDTSDYVVSGEAATGATGAILNHTIVVGNSVAGDSASDCDFLDVGDGAGLMAALAAATTYGGTGVDVLVRNGTYDFEAGTVLGNLAVTPGVRLLGVNRDSVILKTRTTLPSPFYSYAAFTVNEGGAIEEMTIVVQPPVDAYAGGDYAFVAFVVAAALPPFSSLETLGRRVNIVMDGALAALQAVNFGSIARGFNITNGATLDECEVREPWSYIENGGASPFLSFSMDIDYGSNETFRLSKCISRGEYGVANRGGDIGFFINRGPGVLEACAAHEPWIEGFYFLNVANSVELVEPHVTWSTIDNTVGRVAFHFGLGAFSPTTAVTVDNEIVGGFARNIPGAATSTGVLFNTTGGVMTTAVNRNRIRGLVLRDWDQGVYFKETGGPIGPPDGCDSTVFQDMMFKNVVTNLVSDGFDTNTNQFNNVTDASALP